MPSIASVSVPRVGGNVVEDFAIGHRRAYSVSPFLLRHLSPRLKG